MNPEMTNDERILFARYMRNQLTKADLFKTSMNKKLINWACKEFKFERFYIVDGLAFHKEELKTFTNQ